MSRNGKDAKPNVKQGLTQGEQMANALDWIVNDKMFADVELHGNVKWVVLDLVRVAVLWVWSSKRTLVESANDAIGKSRELFSSVGIKSYQVLTNALVNYTSQILPPLQKRMHQLMEKVNSSGFRIGLRMPWAWKIGPSYSSERAHFLELLESEDFPENAMFCGDAGFVGYDFWKTIDTAGHRFLCRVGSNCNFLKKLGRIRERQGIVYCWPKEKQDRKLPPLVMRLLRFHDGRGEVYLVTNELSTSRLSDSLASEIYRNRWGIEVQFRSLKQTFGRSKLLGRTPEIAEQELTWPLVGLWIAQLLALREQSAMKTPDSQTSVAQVLRIFEDILQRADLVPLPGKSFGSRMAIEQKKLDKLVRASQNSS